MREFLEPGRYVDSDHPGIVELARNIVGSQTDNTQKAILLYKYVRDSYFYDPYKIDLREEAMKASHLLTRKHGYCGEKACLLAALGRAVNIPSRLGFARVTNHIGTARLEEFLQSNELVFHGYTEFFLNEKWVKCTPAFNAGLCEKLGVEVMEFDGLTDSIFQEYDREGGKYMEYTHVYGSYADIPKQLMMGELRKYYPHIFETEEKVAEEAYFIFD